MHHDSADLVPTRRKTFCVKPVCGWWLTLIMASALSHADGTQTQTPAAPALTDWTTADWQRLDWKPTDELTPAQKAAVPTACCGAFIQPDGYLSHARPVQDAATVENISISGDRSELTKESTVMTGNVQLTQGQRRISGDHAELFNQPQGANLNGHVMFREPGFLLQGSDLKLDMEHNSLDVNNVHYVLHDQHIHGTASHIQRNAKGVIMLTDNTYSSCTPGDELWYLKSSSMQLDPANGVGKAKNVRIEVLDTPIFYIPYLEFPVGDKRSSGFLMPSFSTGTNGLDIALPYYLNLAPNYDATVIPRSISQRGDQIGGEFRDLSSLSTASAAATWLSNDQQTGDNRWLLAAKETGGIQQPWSTLVDFTRVSDKSYFTDLDNIGLSVSRATHLTERADAGYMTDHWDSNIDVQSYQSLLIDTPDDFYEKLPELSTTGEYYLGQGFSTQLSQSIAHFIPNDPTTQIGGNRLAGDYQLNWRSDQQAIYFAPGIDLHFLQQQLDNPAPDSDPHVVIPTTHLDMGMIFERDTDHYRQTLEPRLYYLYAPYKNQDNFQLFDTDAMTFGYSQLFRDNRFSGNDRIGDANQLSTGITSRWLDQTTGNEWLQTGIGQIFYHDDRRITAYTSANYALLPTSYQNQYTNQQSPLLGNLQWAFAPHWHLNSELAWDEELHHTQNGNVFLHYQGEDKTLFSVGYRYVQLLQWTGAAYVPDTERQADVSSYWPLNNQWGVVGRAFYDFSNHRYLENLAGFQYEDCCWRLRTIIRHWMSNPDNLLIAAQQKTNSGIFLEIEFKNLAGVGTKTSSMLKDSIYGYSETNHDRNESTPY